MKKVFNIMRNYVKVNKEARKEMGIKTKDLILNPACQIKLTMKIIEKMGA